MTSKLRIHSVFCNPSSLTERIRWHSISNAANATTKNTSKLLRRDLTASSLPEFHCWSCQRLAALTEDPFPRLVLNIAGFHFHWAASFPTGLGSRLHYWRRIECPLACSRSGPATGIPADFDCSAKRPDSTLYARSRHLQCRLKSIGLRSLKRRPKR